VYAGGGGWTQSTNGLRPHDNFYMVDGIDSNDPWMAQERDERGHGGGRRRNHVAHRRDRRVQNEPESARGIWMEAGRGGQRRH